MEHIIALGGGGFSNERATGLDLYILEQARVPNPAVGFIPTASGDADAYLLKFYQAFSKLSCRPSHLPLFRRVPELRSYVGSLDVLYVGGGNTKSMLAVWREYGLPEVLRDVAPGVVLAGISAGAICWFDEGLTDASAASLEPMRCLGFIAGSCCPHYLDEAERKPRYRELVGEGRMAAGVAIDDDAAVHFVNGKPHRVVVGRSGVDAYHVAPTTHGGVDEAALGVEHVDVRGA